ncbi:GyrI-like domain-containing protein [Glaesserella sp.]|uniref:GyrI-like domain-containing protein n=1 Tax=Glaesserella sp. TaxID=2094731 RepID=UPI0035A1C357
MDNLKAFNKTIDYIEANLDSEIDSKTVLKLSGYSLAMFGRVFSIMAGFPLGEYIRLRKLTRAAIDLRSSDEKVIDIALKYGYESVDAFSVAFKRFHHQTPSAVKQGADFQVCAVVNFILSVTGGKKMNIRIETKPAFKVAGLMVQATPQTDFFKLWQQLYEMGSHETFAEMGSGQSFGACYEMSSHGSFKYLAGYDICDENKARSFGLEILSVPESEYVVVELIGAAPQSIQAGWKYILEKFFPEHGYKHAGTPDFEAYFEGDVCSSDYKMELWVPIKR